MAGKIFINHRRDDDPGFVQFLHHHLGSEFAPSDLFIDVVEGNIEPGDVFPEVINAKIADADVVLVVIGPRWAALLEERQTDATDDFVMIEIKEAFAQDKRVIPVLVGGAAMPRADSLPEAIRPLAHRNARSLRRGEHFKADCQRLIDALKKILATAAERAARTDFERHALLVWRSRPKQS
jgi:hypothetical protein